ncbi:MAG: hypothetical protein K5648_04200 [Erysipelotrichaceae bacterium]|nr:hypothetical protein [Erysipelotrichaceae bacterium]
MKNVKENLKKTVLVIMVTMIALNVRFYRAYAEEEPVSGPATEEVLDLTEESSENIEIPAAPETENAGTQEENEAIEEYSIQIEETSEELSSLPEEIEPTEEASEELSSLPEEIEPTEEAAIIDQETEEAGLEAEEVSNETSEELPVLTEEIAQIEDETPVVEETEQTPNASYTLYNYISLNDGKSYISLNTQENGITTAKTASEFHKENGNKRYDLLENEYEIADYDLTDLVITTGGFSFVEKSVAKEGQPYFTGRLDRVEAVAAARFRPSDSVEGIESFESLGNDNITFHRNWYLTLTTPMTSNKLLTGVRLGDGKNGNGNGKYYGIEYTEDFQAVDSRFISFGTKLNKEQYSIEDYDFTDLTLEYNGETYAYRPNGPVAGDGEGFHYYTIDFMKLDKLNKSTYGGGYLAENWPKWSLINSGTAGIDGYPYLEGYYHRDYQATLMIGDAPVVIEEETVTEEIAPVVEVEENIEETTEEIKTEEVVETVEEETVTEEIVPIVEVEENNEEVNEEIKNEEVIEVSEEETVTEEIAPIQEAVVFSPVMTVSANTNAPEVHEIEDEVLPQAQAAETVEILVPETVVPQAAPEITEAVGNWALVNLICTLVSILGMILTMNRKEKDENAGKNSFSKLLGIIPAALAILFFLLTEDMNGMMVLTDRYTLMMVLFPLASLLTAWIIGNKKENNRSDLIESPAI